MIERKIRRDNERQRERERERNSQRRMASNDDIDGIYAAEYAGFMPLGV